MLLRLMCDCVNIVTFSVGGGRDEKIRHHRLKYEIIIVRNTKSHDLIGHHETNEPREIPGSATNHDTCEPILSLGPSNSFQETDSLNNQPSQH